MRSSILHVSARFYVALELVVGVVNKRLRWRIGRLYLLELQDDYSGVGTECHIRAFSRSGQHVFLVGHENMMRLGVT